MAPKQGSRPAPRRSKTVVNVKLLLQAIGDYQPQHPNPKDIPETQTQAVARESKVSLDTLEKILKGSHLPTVTTLDKLCATLNLDIRDLLRNGPEHLLERGVAFVAAWSAQAKEAAPMLSVADVDAVCYLNEHLPRSQRVLIKLIMPAHPPEDVVEMWRNHLAERRRIVVVGSPRVNGMFHHAWLDLHQHFTPYLLKFTWGLPHSPAEEKMMQTPLAEKYALTDPDTSKWGVECTRTSRAYVRDPNPGRGGVQFRDVAILAATRRFVIVCGHGPAGTVGAARMLPDYLGRLEELVWRHHAAVLVSQINACCDDDLRPTSAVPQGEPLQLVP